MTRGIASAQLRALSLRLDADDRAYQFLFLLSLLCYLASPALLLAYAVAVRRRHRTRSREPSV